VLLERVDAVRPVDPGRYEPATVFWAHGPRSLVVHLSKADQTFA
jgi:hypothetical protein